MPIGFISFTTVLAKRPKLVPDFVDTLNGTLWSKTNGFKAKNFALVLIPYHTILHENIFLAQSDITDT
jgi:hypothetical protein